MGLITRLRESLVAGRPKNAVLSDNMTMDELAEALGGKRVAGSREALSSATYYACMRIRCDALAKLPVKVLQETGPGGTRKRRDHPLWELLSLRPNEYMTAYDLFWATEFQRLDYGRAFWVLDVKGGERKNIYLLDSSRVEIWVDEAGGTLLPKVWYIYHDPGKGELFYRPEEIAVFQNFAPDGVRGKGIRAYLSGVIQNENDAAAVLRDKYQSGLQDPIIVQYIGDLDTKRKQQIERRFAEFGGSRTAGRVIPVPSELTVSQLETKLVNNQFFELQGLSERQIANAFGVKSFQLNDLERSTYTNITEQNRAFYSDTMQGTITSYEQEMDWVLLSQTERAEGLFVQFNVDAMLRSDPEARMDSYVKAVNNSIRTIAEVREMEGLPFIPGTDRLIRGNGAGIWLSDLGKQYGKTEEPKGGEDGEQEVLEPAGTG